MEQSDFQDDWTDAELKAAVVAYLWMLRQEQEGVSYKKSEVRARLLQGELKNRSEGACEYRMQNISAVMLENGLSIIPGYKPAKNVGPNSKKKLVQLITEQIGSDVFDLEQSNPTFVTNLRKAQFNLKPNGNVNPQQVAVTRQEFKRDARVKAWVLNHARGCCEACGNVAPFEDEDGLPYLEIHHVRRLAEGGSDRIENTVALCPNCHRRSHYSSERQLFTDALYAKISRLMRE